MSIRSATRFREGTGRRDQSRAGRGAARDRGRHDDDARARGRAQWPATDACSAGRRDAALFIHPGHAFAVIRGLVTNFHVPRSSLLMLVCAFAGREQVLQAYERAIAERFRFYSYGDAMLVV